MSVASAEFLALVLVLGATFFYLPGVRLRQAVFFATSIGVLIWASVDGERWPSAATWVALAAFVLSGYAMAGLLRRWPRPGVLAAYLVLLVAVFMVLKKYTVLEFVLPGGWLQHSIVIVGLSYMLFRQIHFLVDGVQGQIAQPRLWTYLNYQLSFATLLAGPIQRYQDFAADWDRSEPLALTPEQRLGLYRRILFGIVKVVILAALCTNVYDTAYANLLRAVTPDGGFVPTRPFLLRNFLLMLYAYPAFVYFNFSGYCDVVIGAAGLLGMRLPENFDRPWISRNMVEFWTRQHMTLSFWIRDYLFTPMYKAVVSRSSALAQPAAYVCYFIAFLLAGIWHGSTMNFVVFGMLHGAGVSTVKIWETSIIQRSGRAGLKRYLQVRWIRIVSTIITLHFVSFAFIFFTPDLDRKLHVLATVVRGLTLGVAANG